MSINSKMQTEWCGPINENMFRICTPKVNQNSADKVEVLCLNNWSLFFYFILVVGDGIAYNIEGKMTKD